MDADKGDLIAKMTGARERLNASLERITPQVEIYPAWKLKQLLDHLTGWDELVASAFRTHARGENPAVTVKGGGIDRYNADSVRQRMSMSLEQSRQAYEAARAEVIQALREMPDDKLDQHFRAPWGGLCTVSSVVKIFVSHELEHAKQIELRQAKA